ncbi:MAG TPA: molybdopterin oxidoreductase, partial [Myxococcota bacterium]
MSREITRRDLFKFVGGAALGIGLTPVPWKMLDDVAIWTQRGHQEPRVPAGEFSVRYTTCTLCPAGCGLRIRCCAGRPVGVTGVPGHPTSRGALCPIGLGVHHL